MVIRYTWPQSASLRVGLTTRAVVATPGGGGGGGGSVGVGLTRAMQLRGGIGWEGTPAQTGAITAALAHGRLPCATPNSSCGACELLSLLSWKPVPKPWKSRPPEVLNGWAPGTAGAGCMAAST